MKKEEWFATIAPGLEHIVQQELSYEGLEGSIDHGGVRYFATREKGAQLVLELFTPNKIRLLLKKVEIKGLSDINKALTSIEWKKIISTHVPIVVDVQTRKSRFFRKDIIRTKSERCMRSIVGMPKPHRQVQNLFLHIEENMLSIYLDAGGGLLHRRGWRKQQGKAPLRETYASALLIASGWSPQEPLWDPFCGSGTIPIEAARMATEATIGVNQAYPVEEWLLKKPVQHRAGKKSPFSITGSDSHEKSIFMATENAHKIAPSIRWFHCGVDECSIDEEGGILVCNPPYGKRLGNNITSVYQHLGELLQKYPTWRAAFIAPKDGLAKKVSKRAQKHTSFSNGGQKVSIWFVPPIKETLSS